MKSVCNEKWALSQAVSRSVELSYLCNMFQEATSETVSVCFWVTFCLSLICENWIRIRAERLGVKRDIAWVMSKCSESWPDDPRSAPVGRHRIYVVVIKKEMSCIVPTKKTLTYEVGTENAKLNLTVRLCLGAVLKGYLYLSHLHILANKMEFVFDICCGARRARASSKASKWNCCGFSGKQLFDCSQLVSTISWDMEFDCWFSLPF